MNAVYDQFRSGERNYDREEDLDSLRADFDAELDEEIQSEVVQIGFRLADALDHERVCPIDASAMSGNDELESLEEGDFEPTEKADVSLGDPTEYGRETEERLADSTITEFLHWENREPQLRVNHDFMFSKGLRYATEDNLGGPKMLSTWYDRNIRMVHNVWRSIERGDERVLFVVGSGHVRILRHLFIEAPMFCPVSPLPYLS